MLKVLKVEASEVLLACRICLDTNTKLYGILDQGISEAFVDITGTTLSADDGYPQYVCGFCAQGLRRAHALRMRACRAQLTLERILGLCQRLTTQYIRAVDREATKLCLPLTATVRPAPIECQHVDIKNVKKELPPCSPQPPPSPISHEGDDVLSVTVKFEDDSNDEVASEPQNEPQKKKRRVAKKELPPSPLPPPSPASHDGEDAPSVKFKADSKDVDVASEPQNEPQNKKRRVATTPKSKRTQTKKIQTEKKINNEKKTEGRKPEKIRDEDFPAFEKEYEFRINILSREQQVEEMAARKEKDNYKGCRFKCEKCFKGFYSEATLGNHHAKHHDESLGPNVCEFCSCRFRIPVFLRKHLDKHRLQFLCLSCSFITNCRSHAMTHSREHRGVRYECQYCGESFIKRTTYDSHVRVQHPDKNKSCEICGETFISTKGVIGHKKRAHRQGAAPGAAPGSATCAACAACGVRFESEYARARHRARAPDGCEAFRACAICGDIFKEEEALRAHARETHRDRQTQCEECDMQFASEASRSVHYERVHLRRKARRRHPTAGRQFKRDRSTGHHVMCEMCGKKCKNSVLLKYHIRSHTGERPHACPHPRCTKRYSTPGGLRFHVSTHAGESTPVTTDKPHACPHCHMRYITNRALQKHLLRHESGDEPPFKCEICSKVFLRKAMLQNHKNVHTGEKPFACHICGKTFTQSGSVHTHVKYVHKKLPAPPRNRGKHKAE